MSIAAPHSRGRADPEVATSNLNVDDKKWILGLQDGDCEKGSLPIFPDMLNKNQLNADPRWPMQRRWPLLCQVCVSLTAAVCLFVILVLYTRLMAMQLPQTNSWTEESMTELLPIRTEAESRSLDSVKRKLINFNEFKFCINNKYKCDVDNIYFIIIVHSKTDHFVQRHVIRKTWGSVRSLNRWNIRTVFLLGEVPNELNFPAAHPHHTSVEDSLLYQKYNSRESWGREDLQKLIDEESKLYNDIVQGNFIDTYHNLTYKHMMAYQWLLNYCRSARYMLKTDDDVWVDLNHLWEYLERTFPSSDPAPRALLCNVFPSGTSPLREGKWAIAMEEYPWEEYPSYCGGIAYLASPAVVESLYGASQSTHFVWVDDVYATGMLPSSVNQSVRHHFMNLRYSFKDEELLEWLEEDTNTSPPYFVVHTNTSSVQWPQQMKKLWHKLKTHLDLEKHSR